MILELNDETASLLLNALNCYSESDGCDLIEQEASDVITGEIMDMQCEKEMRRVHSA